MFEKNIGATIKSVIKIICIIGIIVSLIAGFSLIGQGLGAVGWSVLLVGVLSVLIVSLFLYGFGEIVEKTCENNAALTRIEKELIALKEEKNPQGVKEANDKTDVQKVERSQERSAHAPKAEAVAKTVERPSPLQAEMPVDADPKDNVFDGETMRAIEAMGSGAEIYRYLSEKLDDSDENTRELLKILSHKASIERVYGTDGQGALSAVKSFIKHGNRVFSVNRGDSNLTCPACGREQKSTRNTCASCGALFRM
ncbi:MAG TPA: hypothetical protein IAA52_13500 [Candidatus Pullichristensenella stercorigallinarum]|uniref:Uncharacterized protein n=1 Tax=Candidatus Pullichristensenella stercorigallinarum TaxID=2840909 RepID=A0A9D0ZPA7_9FIRM|nr:hypothetical protein [Candidatus Pullichristensenella stercorigallinarum]